MVIPFTSSVAREVLKSVPIAQREGAYALGATRFEAISAALYYARTGIVGAVMLGFGRALGETMAVTMVIGNTPASDSLSLFAPQHTMAAVIANQFREAADELYLHALIEIGLVLFIVTLIVNSLVASADLEHEAAPRRGETPSDGSAGGYRGGTGMSGTLWRKTVSSLFVAFCAPVGPDRARAARIHSVFRRQPAASRP